MVTAAPDPAAFRFEMVCEAIAPDGTRTRVGSYPVPPRCLVCGGPVLDAELRMLANLATVNNVAGLICRSHPGVWVH